MSQERECTCQTRTKVRSDKEKRALMNRLSRIEGQIRGIRAMVERDAYCPDVLIQAAAAAAAINSFSKELLGEHIRTCVTEDIRSGGDEAVEEVVAIIRKFMR